MAIDIYLVKWIRFSFNAYFNRKLQNGAHIDNHYRFKLSFYSMEQIWQKKLRLKKKKFNKKVYSSKILFQPARIFPAAAVADDGQCPKHQLKMYKDL